MYFFPVLKLRPLEMMGGESMVSNSWFIFLKKYTKKLLVLLAKLDKNIQRLILSLIMKMFIKSCNITLII